MAISPLYTLSPLIKVTNFDLKHCMKHLSFSHKIIRFHKESYSVLGTFGILHIIDPPPTFFLEYPFSFKLFIIMLPNQIQYTMKHRGALLRNRRFFFFFFFFSFHFCISIFEIDILEINIPLLIQTTCLNTHPKIVFIKTSIFSRCLLLLPS
jgi:hypothetical protein